MATHDDNKLRERPLGEVAKDLTSDLSLLVRQEIELAEAEMAEKGGTAAPGVAMCGARVRGGERDCGRIGARAARQGASQRCGQASSRTDHRDREGGRGMDKDAGDIRTEIEQTRERVGDQVDALSYKTDVGARVGDYVGEKKDAVTSKVTGAKETVTGAMPDRRALGRGASSVRDTAQGN